MVRENLKSAVMSERPRKFVKRNRVYLLALFALCLSSCGLVIMCVESPKTIRQAEKLTQYTPLTVDRLSSMLREDTVHYKFVVFFSYCCDPCASHMAYTYPQMMETYKKDSVKWYFIAKNTAQLERAEQMMRANKISEPLYYLRDTASEFKTDNPQQWNNITNYLFSNGEKVTGNLGIPVNFIVSKDNKVIKQYIVDSNKVGHMTTQDIYWLKGELKDLDFDKVDTLTLDFPLFGE